MTDPELIEIIRGMLTPGLEVSIGTVKAAVITDDRARVAGVVAALVAEGEIVQVKRDRYQLA